MHACENITSSSLTSSLRAPQATAKTKSPNKASKAPKAARVMKDATKATSEPWAAAPVAQGEAAGKSRRSEAWGKCAQSNDNMPHQHDETLSKAPSTCMS